MTDSIDPLAVPSPAAPARAGQVFEAVQILRGVAASLVVFHHYCLAVIEYHPSRSAIATFHRLAELGAGGVDIFFCISGLVITHSSRKLAPGLAPAVEFARRRLLRVIPPYWIFTAVLLLLWATGIGLKGMVMTTGLVITSLLLIPYPKLTMDGAVKYHPILDVGWTLTYEMYFYALCAIIVGLAGGRRMWPGVFVALVLAGLASWLLTGADSIASSIFASPLLIEFALGVAIARFAAGREAPRSGWAFILLGTVAFSASIFIKDPMAYRMLCWGLPGALLVLGCVLIRVDLRSRVVRAGVFLGTASYTVYLVHPLFTLVASTLLKRGLLDRLDPDMLLIMLTLVTIPLAASTYFLVEGPLIRLFKPRSKTAAMAREAMA